MNEKLLEIGKAAKEAAFLLASAGAKKDEALACMSEQLLADTPFILAENALDVENARAKGITEAMIDRLTLTKARIPSHRKRPLKGQGSARPVK